MRVFEQGEFHPWRFELELFPSRLPCGHPCMLFFFVCVNMITSEASKCVHVAKHGSRCEHFMLQHHRNENLLDVS